MIPIIPFLLFLLIPPLFSNQTSLTDEDNGQPLEIVNGAQNILLEIEHHPDEKRAKDQGLLICFPSISFNNNGNAKASRRFQLLDQGYDKFGRCRKLTNGPHIGILFKYQWNDLNIETSFGFHFACSIEGKKIFGIQLREAHTLLSSMKGCEKKLNCGMLNEFGESFKQSMMSDGGGVAPYMDDFGPIWYLGINTLKANTTSRNSKITYFGNFSSWSITILNVRNLDCSEQNITTAMTKPTKKITITTVWKEPIGLKELKKPNKTKPGHVFEFGIDMINLACNKTQYNVEKAEHANKNKPLWHPVSGREYSELIENRACLGYLKAPTEQDGICHHENSAIVTICYDGLLDPNKTGHNNRFQLPNLPGNKIAELCQKNLSANTIRHGFTVGACAERIQYKKDGKRFSLLYKIIFNVSLSYSEMNYSYATNHWVHGNIDESDGFHQRDEGSVSFQTMTIQIANGSSLFANLVDANRKMHNYAEYIEAKLGSKETKFAKIAKGKHALGLLGRDLIPQYDNDTSWNRNLQFFSPQFRCNTLRLDIDNETTLERKNCYKRAPNFCDEMGKEHFDELITKNQLLQELRNNCTCEDLNQTLGTPPPHIPYPEDPKPNVVHRKKRSLNAKKSDDKRLIPGCENAYDRIKPFGSAMRFQAQLLDEDIEEQRKCCPNETNTNYRRLKRQLNRFVNLWKTPIAYRFASEEQLEQWKVKDIDKWKQDIRKGLKHFPKLTCVRFYENDTAENDTPHLDFQAVPGLGCRAAIGGGWLTLDQGCAADESTVTHEVLHTLGIHHEQNREDRDKAVWISFERAKEGGNYQKAKTDQRGLPYDFGSVMHYSADNEMIPRNLAYQQSVRVEGVLSFKDAKLINIIYCTTSYPHKSADPSVTRCEFGTSKWNNTCKNGGYLDPVEKCEKCRCPRGYDGEQCTELEESDYECELEMELNANEEWQILESNKKAEKCIWRIRNNADKYFVLKKRVSIEFLEIGFECKGTCHEWVEIKYDEDKTANGAHVCCKFPGDRMPYIIAEDYGTEVLLLLNNPKKRASFKLQYRAEPQPTKPGNNCQSPMKLQAGPDRSPNSKSVCEGTNFDILKKCEDEWRNTYPKFTGDSEFEKCILNQKAFFLTECDKTTGDFGLACPWNYTMEVNGVVILREIDCTDEDIKNVIRNPEKFSTCKHCTDERIKRLYPVECQEAIYLWCLNTDEKRTDGGDHYYLRDKDGDLTRVSELTCRPPEPPSDV